MDRAAIRKNKTGRYASQTPSRTDESSSPPGQDRFLPVTPPMDVTFGHRPRDKVQKQLERLDEPTRLGRLGQEAWSDLPAGQAGHATTPAQRPLHQDSVSRPNMDDDPTRHIGDWTRDLPPDHTYAGDGRDRDRRHPSTNGAWSDQSGRANGQAVATSLTTSPPLSSAHRAKYHYREELEVSSSSSNGGGSDDDRNHRSSHSSSRNHRSSHGSSRNHRSSHGSSGNHSNHDSSRNNRSR